MDIDNVEVIDLNALGNTDTTTVNDLSGTDLVEINIDLAGTIGGTAGDGQADIVIVNATNGDDIIDVVGAGTSVSVIGLSTRVNITNSEGANDSLVVNALGGNDTVTATTLPAGVIKLTVDGAPATIRFLVRRLQTYSLAARATTLFSAITATIWRLWAPATTCSSGIRATATTRSKDKTVSIVCCSTAPAPAKTSTYSPTAGASVLAQRGERHDGSG